MVTASMDGGLMEKVAMVIFSAAKVSVTFSVFGGSSTLVRSLIRHRQILFAPLPFHTRRSGHIDFNHIVECFVQLFILDSIIYFTCTGKKTCPVNVPLLTYDLEKLMRRWRDNEMIRAKEFTFSSKLVAGACFHS